MQCSWGYAQKSVPHAVTYILGAAINFHSTSTGKFQRLLAFWQGISRQVFIQFDASGHVVATSDNGTVFGTSTAEIRLSGWHYVEALCTVSNSVGVVIVHVDGLDVLNLTGIDTQSTGNTWIDAISVGSDQQFELTYVDDLYVCDTSGIVNNIFLGPINIVPAYPNAAGGFTAFTAGGTLSGSNFGQLDETPPNVDTD